MLTHAEVCGHVLAANQDSADHHGSQRKHFCFKSNVHLNERRDHSGKGSLHIYLVTCSSHENSLSGEGARISDRTWRLNPYIVFFQHGAVPTSGKKTPNLSFLSFPSQPLFSSVFFALVESVRDLSECFSLFTLGYGRFLENWRERFLAFFSVLSPLVCLLDGLCKIWDSIQTTLKDILPTQEYFSCVMFVVLQSPQAAEAPLPSYEEGLSQGKRWLKEWWRNTIIHVMRKDDVYFMGVSLILAIAEMVANGESPGHNNAWTHDF